MGLINFTRIFKAKEYSNIPPIPESMWRNPLHFIAFGFGTGAIPFAPGTWGTLIAIPFYLLVQPLSSIAYTIVTLFIVIGSILICDKTTKDIGIHDHQGMCLDEIAGFFVTMLFAPRGWIWIVTGFLLFRFFDIVKPWPIRAIDAKLSGGLGIVLDDVLAGIFSAISIQILFGIFSR